MATTSYLEPSETLIGGGGDVRGPKIEFWVCRAPKVKHGRLGEDAYDEEDQGEMPHH